MDTSGLASGLSLAVFLVVFSYLGLVEHASVPAALPSRTSDILGRFLFAMRLLRWASVVAIVLSAEALLVSQGAPAVGLIAVVALGLLAFLVIADRGSKLLSSRYPTATSKTAFPFQALALSLLNFPRASAQSSAEPGRVTSVDHNGMKQDFLNPATVVITEEEQARLDTRERSMIRSILRLDDTMAREVMAPRVDIVALEASTPLVEVASKMLECGHSRLPVYSETIDNIIGVVHSRDLLPFFSTADDFPPLEKIIRPAFFIPESKRLDDLMRELQEKRVQMALVVDEYGGIEGLVTLEDLLEEIVGEIEDEFSRSLEPRVVPAANGDIIVDARVSLDYISDLFGASIGDEDVDTIGGLVYSTLGKMPQVGDEIVYNGLQIQVVSLLGRRIRKLKLSRTAIREAE